MEKIAVIIPAYRATFLQQALTSLANQTNKNFTVYIGDDCSPDDIQSVAAQFSSELSVEYHRFESNLGGKDLVAQWERCANLKKEEEWIWIFSDDDEAEPECVAAFYKSLQSTGSQYDVYRFNTRVIDATGSVTSDTPVSPLHQDALELAFNILWLRTGNSMPDHIFRWQKYRELDGFLHTRFAQAADWGSSINFAYPHGLYSIPGPKVRWRLSGQNLSSVAGSRKAEMIFGHIEFLQWVSKRFSAVDFATAGKTPEELKSALRYNFVTVTQNHYKGIPVNKVPQVLSALVKIKGFTWLESAKLCMVIIYNLHPQSIVARVIRKIRK